eukprot:scaffold14836_cov134-Cylindrotheca_fusiformis.AAC.1
MLTPDYATQRQHQSSIDKTEPVDDQRTRARNEDPSKRHSFMHGGRMCFLVKIVGLFRRLAEAPRPNVAKQRIARSMGNGQRLNTNTNSEFAIDGDILGADFVIFQQIISVDDPPHWKVASVELSQLSGGNLDLPFLSRSTTTNPVESIFSWACLKQRKCMQLLLTGKAGTKVAAAPGIKTVSECESQLLPSQQKQ